MTRSEKEINISRTLKNGLYQYSINLPKGPTVTRIYGVKTEDGQHYVLMQESATGMPTPLASIPRDSEDRTTPEYLANSSLLVEAIKAANKLGESRKLEVNLNPIEIE